MEATGQSMQLDLGHWLLRLIAYIIDWVIVGIIVGILWLIVVLPFLVIGAIAGFFAAWGWVVVFPFIVGLLMVLYVLYAEVNWGGTLGKRILGLRVQTVKGGKINYSQSFIRNISKIHPLFLLLDWLIGIATPGDRRQKYTDRIAGVTVVQVNQTFASVAPPPAPSQ
jgi:uncharacterized RDD family membrane protein YckC